MTEEMVMSLGVDALKTSLMLAGPILLGTMVIGLLVSVFQAVTQINEATLTFIPKMIVVIVILAIAGPWMLQNLQEYAASTFNNAGEWVKR